MQSHYFDQPILSSSAVAAFLSEVGLDFAAWPQSELPENILRSMDAGTDDDIKMLEKNDAAFAESAEKYRAEFIEKNHAPRAVVRTNWGLLIGEKLEANMAAGIPFTRYSVDVHCTKGWGNKRLGAYCDACMALLDKSLQDFLRRHRTDVIEMKDAAGDGILELSVSVMPDKQDNSEEMLTKYLIQIFEDGMLNNVIEVGCAD